MLQDGPQQLDRVQIGRIGGPIPNHVAVFFTFIFCVFWETKREGYSFFDTWGRSSMETANIAIPKTCV
jgi:hypothetical protein